jgi:transketolase
MILDKRKAVGFSRIGSRAAYGMTLFELAPDYDDLMVVTADTSTSAGLDRFRKTFPEKYLDVGIAEQNAMGVAAGLASEGMRVALSTFAPFQTMRCCEQIKVNLGYMKHKVVFTGLASGVVLGTLGYTHCCIEDMAIMRSIPNITVLSPADCGETAKAVEAALNHHESVYIRLTGGSPNPPVYKEDYDFEIGESVKLRDGADVGIIATGTMVHASLKAAELLAEDGIDATVLNMHTIKPIDADAVKELSKTTKLIATVEEHTLFGGLGSAVAEAKAPLKNAPAQIMMGITDSYDKSGDYANILTHYGLTADQIAAKIKVAL